jgi:predicted outer membrane protein
MQASAGPMVASTVPPGADAGKNPTLKGKDLDRTPTGSTAAGAGTDITPDAVPAPLPPVGSADTRLPRGQEDLDSLEGLEGKAFDADYKDKQKDALQQVETDYSDYVAKGNDPTLLAIAKRELPLVRKRLAALARV